jgi:hypothetical protein
LQTGVRVFAVRIIDMQHFDMRVRLQPCRHLQAGRARLTVNKYPKTHAAQ